MDREQYLMQCLAEEALEVAHRVSKLLRFGPHETQPGQPLDNVQRLVEEIQDFNTVRNLLVMRGSLPAGAFDPSKAKIGKLIKYGEHSRQQGCLNIPEGETLV